MGEYVLGKSFTASQEIADPKYFNGKLGNEIRKELENKIKNWGLFSFVKDMTSVHLIPFFQSFV